MNNFQSYGRSSATSVGRTNGGSVFWLLALMGVGAFAPCVILPEWRDYQTARLAEQREQHRLDRLKRVVERERLMLDALQNDSGVVARLAQRDLGFLRRDAKVVSVRVPGVVEENDGTSFVSQPVTPPEWFEHVSALLPDVDYDAIFCDARTRSVVMVMSVSLILVSVILFHRRTPVQSESPHNHPF